MRSQTAGCSRSSHPPSGSRQKQCPGKRDAAASIRFETPRKRGEINCIAPRVWYKLCSNGGLMHLISRRSESAQTCRLCVHFAPRTTETSETGCPTPLHSIAKPDFRTCRMLCSERTRTQAVSMSDAFL
eukprot:3941935-Rhodomonas_salina.2